MSTDTQAGPASDALLLEERRYEPLEDFAAQANADASIYQRDFEEFWEIEGRKRITWLSRSTSCSSGSCRTRSGTSAAA